MGEVHSFQFSFMHNSVLLASSVVGAEIWPLSKSDFENAIPQEHGILPRQKISPPIEDKILRRARDDIAKKSQYL